jgi:hypothetical protein
LCRTIRKKAAIACTKLLISKNERPSLRGPAATVIDDVLTILLRVVLTDMGTLLLIIYIDINIRENCDLDLHKIIAQF